MIEAEIMHARKTNKVKGYTGVRKPGNKMEHLYYTHEIVPDGVNEWEGYAVFDMETGYPLSDIYKKFEEVRKVYQKMHEENWAFTTR